MTAFLSNTVEIALAAAPWLVLGLLAAGLIRAWLPATAIGGRLAGCGLGAVGRAALIGAPLPLCSCGVLPAAFGLRQAGASKAATASFLVSTPETGVDSIALSWVLLGPPMAIARPIAALVSAVVSGLAVGAVEGRADASVDPTAPARMATDAMFAAGHEDHAHSGAALGGRVPRAWQRTWAGLGYAFTDLLDDLAMWLGIGLVVAGVVLTLVPPAALAAWGSGLGAMVLMLLVAVPMYVCATAATPLALAMLHAGVSAGTVLVFLLAGPATNCAGIVLLRRALGDRAFTAYLAGVCATAVALGLALDAALVWLGIDVVAGVAAEVGRAPPLWLSVPCLAVLILFAVRPLRRRLLRLGPPARA